MKYFNEDSRSLLAIVGPDDGDFELRVLFEVLLSKAKKMYPDVNNEAEAWGLVAFSEVQ